MANDMIAKNKALFDRLLSSMPDEFRTGSALVTKRYITTNDQQKTRLKSAVVVSREQLVPSFDVTCISASGSHYISWVGQPVSKEISDQYFEDCSDCSGLCTFLWADSYWPLAAIDPYLIAETIAERSGAFRRDEISPLFGATQIIRWDPNRFGAFSKERAPQVLFGMNSLSDSTAATVFSQPTRLRLLDILSKPTGIFFAGQLFLATSTRHWQHAFLELYRCIEQVFPLPFLRSFHGSMQSRHSSFSVKLELLSEWVQRDLNWRPKELDALRAVLAMCDDCVLKTSLKKFGKVETYSNDASTLAEAIYSVRNSCAHARRLGLVGTGGNDWEPQLDALSELLSELVSKLTLDDLW